MKILVTGAAGFIGYHLAVALAKDPQNELILVDNFIRGERDDMFTELLMNKNVTFMHLDLRDWKEVQMLPDVEVVYHMAALNGTQNFYERPFDVVTCCSTATVNLLKYYAEEQYANKDQFKRFILAGTSESYAAGVTHGYTPVPTPENAHLMIDDIFNERWSYGGAKILSELAVVAAHKQFGMDFTIIRFHNTYGPRMGDKHVMPDFITRVHETGMAELYGHSDTRSFLYIDDAVRGTIELGTSEKTKNDVFNLGSEDQIKMLDLGYMMLEVMGRDQGITLHDSPKGSVPRRSPSMKKTRKTIGFIPEVTLEYGLEKTIEFYTKS